MILKLICMHCGEAFEGNNEKFCSQACRDSHISMLNAKTIKATMDDPGHTEKFTQDS